jgi:UDP-N-acetylmuramyl pentapeptide phosphotransferase/UDP-N-acetylglucosamine-1-phosphate transferase
MVDAPGAGGPPERPSTRGLDPRVARALGLLIVIGVVVAVVVQNSQRVTIRFLFITGHVQLIWVLVVCLVVAGAVGFVAGRRGRRRRRRRSSMPD